MADHDSNKKSVISFFDRLSEGDLDGLLALMDEEVLWRVAGDPARFALAGTYSKDEFTDLMTRLGALMSNGVNVVITGVTAEDDRYAIEAEITGTTADGAEYHNYFHYLLQMRHGKIYRVREYLDTQHANEILLGVHDNSVSSSTR